MLSSAVDRSDERLRPFQMKEAAQQSLLRLTRAPLVRSPFAHIYVKNVFPTDFYAEIRANLPSDEVFAEGSAYPNRRLVNPKKLGNPFWDDLIRWMTDFGYVNQLCRRFMDVWVERWGEVNIGLSANVRLVRDEPAYSLSPHTDTPNKFLSFLFYLPENDELRDFGTTIFLPKDRTRTSDGMDWLEWEGFDPIWTAPFIPNSCFAFGRTDRSFHGVLPHPEATRQRNALLLNIDAKPMPNADQ